MKTSYLMLAILACFMIPAPTQAAAPHNGGYMSGFIGSSLINSTDVTTDDYVANSTYNDEVKFHPGIDIGMTGGYDFGHFRMEGELSYKNGSIKSITDKSDNYRFRNVDGDFGALAIMFNGFFDLHNDSPVTPYLGGGVGFATLSISDTYGTDTRGGTTTRALLYREDDAAALAWQFGGGMEISMSQTFSLDFGYRYFGTTKETFDDYWDQSTGMKFEGHNVSVGFKIKY